MDYIFPEGITTIEEKKNHLEEILALAPAESFDDATSTWSSMKRVLDQLDNS